MPSPLPFARRRKTLLGLSLFIAAVSRSPAQSPSPPVPDQSQRLADCLALGHELQPALTVARSRLTTALSKLAALETLGVTAHLMRHDLPVRRQQAHLGAEIARADLERLEVENRYEVTRAYLSVLYSRTQRRLLDDLVEDLTFLRDRIKTAVGKRERPEWTEATVDLVTLYLRKAEARRTEADRGIEVSLAALREATGVGPLACLRVADEPLPEPRTRVCREEILAAALSHRGEAFEANTAAEVVGLEADAQSRSCRRGAVPTFASGVDIHSRLVQPPMRGEDYRPGGVPLAMPVTLVGPRTSRVELAQGYGAQATEIGEKTRNLIALEAEEAYFTWEEWSRKVVLYREAEQIATRLARRLREDFRGSLKRVIEGILPESLLAAQARADHNEALFRQAIALANLERVTGGAFCAGLALPPHSR
jgi:outer membrane protein TolC